MTARPARARDARRPPLRPHLGGAREDAASARRGDPARGSFARFRSPRRANLQALPTLPVAGAPPIPGGGGTEPRGWRGDPRSAGAGGGRGARGDVSDRALPLESPARVGAVGSPRPAPRCLRVPGCLPRSAPREPQAVSPPGPPQSRLSRLPRTTLSQGVAVHAEVPRGRAEAEAIDSLVPGQPGMCGQTLTQNQKQNKTKQNRNKQLTTVPGKERRPGPRAGRVSAGSPESRGKWGVCVSLNRPCHPSPQESPYLAAVGTAGDSILITKEDTCPVPRDHNDRGGMGKGWRGRGRRGRRSREAGSLVPVRGVPRRGVAGDNPCTPAPPKVAGGTGHSGTKAALASFRGSRLPENLAPRAAVRRRAAVPTASPDRRRAGGRGGGGAGTRAGDAGGMGAGAAGRRRGGGSPGSGGV